MIFDQLLNLNNLKISHSQLDGKQDSEEAADLSRSYSGDSHEFVFLQSKPVQSAPEIEESQAPALTIRNEYQQLHY